MNPDTLGIDPTLPYQAYLQKYYNDLEQGQLYADKTGNQISVPPPLSLQDWVAQQNALGRNYVIGSSFATILLWVLLAIFVVRGF